MEELDLKKITLTRIDKLIEFARKIAKKYPEYAIKHIKTARRIAMRHKIPIGSKRKQLFCKNCNFPYIKGGYKKEIKGYFVYYWCKKCNYCYKIHKQKALAKI
jgi:RNase P subunit RPR2